MSEPSEGPYKLGDFVSDGQFLSKLTTVADLHIARGAYAQGRQSLQAEVEALKAELKTNAGRLKTMTDIGSILATEIGLCPNKEAHPSEGVLIKHFPAKKEKP